MSVVSRNAFDVLFEAAIEAREALNRLHDHFTEKDFPAMLGLGAAISFAESALKREKAYEENLKLIPVKELVSSGALQEINRRVLHPAGMAFVVVEATDPEESDRILGVMDRRDDPEGLAFSESYLDRSKFEKFEELLKSKENTRKERLGYVVQPIPEGE